MENLSPPRDDDDDTTTNNNNNTKDDNVEFEKINHLTWNIIDKYFEDNPYCLVAHHLESYDDFYKNGIYKIFKEKNPVKLFSNYDETIHDYRNKCEFYFGGKSGDKLHFGKPNIYDKNNEHYMFPNEARLRNMDYSMTIHYDVDVEFIDILKDGEEPEMVGGNLEDNEEAHNGGISKNYKNKGNVEKTNATATTTTTGGAPTTQRKKKTNQLDIDPNMATIIRQATEKSVVGNVQRRQITLSNIFLGKFPIMVQSSFCILNSLPKEIRFNMGECKNDLGGYFIVGGKEKVIIPQEKFGDNMLYIRSYDTPEILDKTELEYLHSVEIRSVSENSSKPIRTFSIRMVAPSSKYTNENMVAVIPNVRKPVPLFILFRALGFITDKKIIQMCLLDMEKYESMLDLFIPSIHDAGSILSQQTAIKYIASLTKGKTVTHAIEILTDYLLPHIGETNYVQKAYYLGYMVFRLLSVQIGFEPKTDRDNFKFKRIELVGSLLYDLFREYYNIQQKQIYVNFEQLLYYHKSLYESDLKGLVETNYRNVFAERTLESGFKKAFKGNWGAYTHTKRIGIVQDLNRLSFNTVLSHLRKISLPFDSSLKIVGPRLLHNSQWGFIDPIDTPDGGNIGLHKSLAITSQITRGFSRGPLINWLRENVEIVLLESCTPVEISKMTKLFVNGYWAGCVNNPLETVEKIKLHRRNALIPIYTSATFEIKSKTIYIYTDSGRLCRPIFYMCPHENKNKNVISFQKNKEIGILLKDGEFYWNELVAGFHEKKPSNYNIFDGKIYDVNELYGISPKNLTTDKSAIIDFIDSSETENTMIAVNYLDLNKKPKIKFTHCEIHESLLLGVMCNQIAFPENNPLPRDLFSTGQSKQACSLYHTNYQVRMDKTAVVLNYGQRPLIKSRYLKHINNEENPYGVNAIVAIMCYTGYNVEDAILINEASIKRGLFRTTYYTTYETHEENGGADGENKTEMFLTNIEENDGSVVGTKPGYDYSALDKNGVILEGTPVNDKTILIGMTANSGENDGKRVDNSKKPKKGQLGVVDKTFITEGEQGERIAKVRVCEQRIPTLGDKFASTVGQKGTIGMVVPECDMPFTIDGTRPDMIINPHALPSRMTIGQLISSVTGKACLLYGGFGDCTAFNQRGSKIHFYGEQLSNHSTTDTLLKEGFHSSGNEILYNGMTGEQIESEIFIGPTYYMRLKHMVKDKINYRASGPRSVLTRQPVSGRANDGGLRVGEMEKDSILSHGMSAFLQDSMMEKGDKYQLAICNQSGMTAIYNPSTQQFISPMIDGPIQFSTDIENQMHMETVSRFGRSFSIVNVPYCFKLLMQELSTINVQMRIITEDNIEQFENMSFKYPLNSREYVQSINYELSKQTKPRDENPEMGYRLFPYEEPSSQSPEYVPGNYIPPENTESIPYAPPQSPEYTPPESTDSIAYASTSPAYVPQINGGNLTQTDIVSEHNNNNNFVIGENVKYKNDIKNRIWYIKDIFKNLVTISTNDSVVIANMDEIERILDTSKIPSNFFNEHYNDENCSSSNKGIIFSPVININSGNGNGNEPEIPLQQLGNNNNNTNENTNPLTRSHLPSYSPQSPQLGGSNDPTSTSDTIIGGIKKIGVVIVKKLTG